MRVAFFLTYFPKISEAFLLNQALALLDRGHDVHVYALADPSEARIQPDSERLLPDRAHIGRMSRGWRARLIDLPGLIASNRPGEALRALNVTRYGVEAASLRTLYRLDAVRDVDLDCDVAHAQFGDVARQCIMLRDLGKLRAPLFTSFRGNDLSAYLSRARANVYTRVFEGSRFCLPVAQRWVETLASLGCPREKIRPFPSGIPMDQVPRRRLDDWGEEGFPRIISAARLDRYKGLHLGLEAFQRLLVRFPNASYEVFGDGAELERLRSQARRLGITRHVQFHGAALHREVLEALSRCHIHWFTTHTMDDGRTEGVPNILKETQAAGLPVVAFEHPGVEEVVIPGRTGILVSPGSSAALADETIRLANDPERARRWGEQASRHAREVFDLGHLTDRLEELYDLAVSRP